MTDNLTAGQTALLLDYCESQGLKYYDVQLEVIDHMASAIEERTAAGDSSFEEVFTAIKLQFDNAVFKKIVRTKKWVIIQNTCRLFAREGVSFFFWPKMLITLCIAILIFSLPADEATARMYPALLLVFFYTSLFFNGGIIGKNGTQQTTPLISLDMMKVFQGVIIVLIPGSFARIYYLIRKIAFFHDNIILLKLIWLLFVIISLAFYLISVKTNRQIRRQYPLAFCNE